MSLKALLGKRGFAHLTVPPDVPLRDAIRRMIEARARALVVVAAGKPAGILSESDILRFHLDAEGGPFDSARVSDAMTVEPIVVEISEDAGRGLDMMLGAGIGCLPVVDGSRLAGVIFLRELLQDRIAALGDELDLLRNYVDSLQDAMMD